MINDKRTGSVINQNALPENYPTNMHEGEFWENLGRVVATFGFLEEVLAKAIFSFTATKKFKKEEIEEAYAKWLPKLERSLSDPLRGLIDTYRKSVRDNSEATIEDLDNLLTDLIESSELRNVLCHGSWRTADSKGASIPFFVNRQNEVFETPINIAFLKQVQKNTCDLACDVINSVTSMGWQFPGTNGPGKVIWNNK